jgi:hypothetical protein
MRDLAKATTGIEPVHGGFADRSVPISPRRRDGPGSADRIVNPEGAGEGTRTLDLLHGKQTL